MSDPPSAPEAASSRRGPLDRDQRRVLGVLVEKAKTTPDNYPMTLSALVSGANQKSNRSPQMQMDEDDVLIALDALRAQGAATEVQGAGRVNKYRHAAYEWLDVNSKEAAVMTELLLRGPQTAGELRGRASRMEPLPDLANTNAVLEALIDKGLVVPLGRPGRGQQFTHTLYEPDEQARLAKTETVPPAASAPAATAVPDAPSADEGEGSRQALQQQIDELRQRVVRLEAALSSPPADQESPHDAR